MTDQKKSILETVLPFIAVFTASCAMILVNGILTADLSANVGDQHQGAEISTDIDTTWRYTKDGWQDASTWEIPDTFRPIRTFELIHPFVWATTVLLAVVATLVWASNESEIDGLLSNDQVNLDDEGSGD